MKRTVIKPVVFFSFSPLYKPHWIIRRVQSNFIYTYKKKKQLFLRQLCEYVKTTVVSIQAFFFKSVIVLVSSGNVSNVLDDKRC